jgi:DNA-binding response OmpR family regulator
VSLEEATGRFNELDTAREDVVAHDPPSLGPSSASLPSFEDIPEVLRHVLVVDDNRVFRAFLKELLAARGFTVYEAPNGAEGLKLALEKRPWLIVTDIRMPGNDGFELCRQVRAHSLIRQTPLLFLSGWDDYKARYHALELGADDFVSKETSVRELLIRMQLILKRYMAMGRGARGSAMEGQLQVMGAPGVLQVCHLARLTGTLTIESGTRRMAVRFREGEIVSASGSGREGAEAVYELLSWEYGRFQFAPGEAGDDPGLPQTFSQLVLEGCRQLDELRRGAGPAAD